MPLLLGRYSTYYYTGYIQDFRITKRAVYCDEFTPSTQLHDPCITCSDFGDNLATVGGSIGTEHPSYIGKAFDGIIDGTGNADGDTWYAHDGTGYTNTGWVGQDFGTPTIIDLYRIHIKSPTNEPHVTDPRDWTFEGSNDQTVWDVLHTVTDFTSYPGWSSFEFANSTSYRYYRMNISANNGDSTYVRIRELEMYKCSACVPQSSWETYQTFSDTPTRTDFPISSAIPETDSYTISTIFRMNGLPPQGSHGYFVPITFNGTNGGFQGLLIYPGSTVIQALTHNTWPVGTANLGLVTEENTWYNIVIVKEMTGSTATFSYYVNGVLADTHTKALGAHEGLNINAMSLWNYGQTWHELAVFDRALTLSEISTIYCGNTSAVNPIHHWPMSSNAFTVNKCLGDPDIYDLAGNSDVVITNIPEGTDPLAPNTDPYSPFTRDSTCEEVSLLIQSDTTDESDAIIDTSGNNHAITVVGSVHHETDQKKYGGSSLYFNGVDDYLSIPKSSDPVSYTHLTLPTKA